MAVRYWVFRLTDTGKREEKVGGPFDDEGGARECVRILERETSNEYEIGR